MRKLVLACSLAVLSLVALSSSSEAACVSGIRPNGTLEPHWPLNATVYWTYNGSSGPLDSVVGAAFARWTAINNSISGVRFVRADAAHPAVFTVRTGPTSQPTAPAETRLSFTDNRNHHMVEAVTTVDLGHWLLNPNLPGYESALGKVMLHEIGHTVGLPDSNNLGPQQPGQTIMNDLGGVNDLQGNMPDDPTPCDRDAMREAYELPPMSSPNPPIPRSPERRIPDNAPSTPLPFPCPKIVGETCTGMVGGPQVCTPIWVWGMCLDGDGSPNAPGPGPWHRSPGSQLKTQARQRFLEQFGYACEMSGWLSVETNCEWDLCCIHPDDLPSGAPAPPLDGTPCQDLGWYNGDQYNECLAAHTTCERKQICNGGGCVPAPYYCWKSSAPPPPPPTPAPPPGKTCPEMGWYVADQYNQCVAASGGQACTKKQTCGTGDCMPWPNYCWMGVPLPTPAPTAAPTPAPTPEPEEDPTNSCGSQNFYEGDDYGTCVRDCGTCTRKQYCGNKPCGGIGYCWRCG